MRKNGVNRNVTAIEGGICAPEGFLAGACACGIRAQGEDLALLLADCRCAAAAVFADGSFCGAPSVISKKHLRDGYARAIVANGGVANTFLLDGEKFADKVCGLVERRFVIRKEDVLIASTGEIGKTLQIENFERGVKELPDTLGKEESGARMVRALAGEDGVARQMAFSFEIGDFTCKMGVLFKATAHVCPNMATTLVFLTTDVNIVPEILQKALSAATRETVNLLNIDGISSPNDGVFLLANGRAGNSKIDCLDTEYKKFLAALQLVLRKVCRAIATSGERKGLYCEVLGAKSKQIAREVSKKLVGTGALKKGIQNGEADVDGVLYTLAELYAAEDFSAVKIAIKTPQAKLLVFEDGKKMPQNRALVAELLSEKEITVEIDLGVGNYKSVAFGCVD